MSTRKNDTTEQHVTHLDSSRQVIVRECHCDDRRYSSAVAGVDESSKETIDDRDD